ncbi:MAG TPA: H-NS histone family protein [Candidimonas sp.]|nr:H-NS histone family protein [Candidimonas sp.]
MPRDSYPALKEKIQKEILKLQKQAKALQVKQRGPVVASIVKSMRDYDITPEEIAAAYTKKATRAPKQPGTSTTTVKRSVPPKYRHPDTGATWTGRGKPPRWITAAEAEGRKRTDFLIEA